MAGAAWAQAPDASPTIAVETVALENFEPTRDEALIEAFIDGVVDAHMRNHKAPGVTVSFVRGGKVLFAKGYGHSDIENQIPVSGQDTLFRIGSISKTFIWVAAMKLAQEGKIDLDTDVNTYLKGLKLPATYDAPVTMNHLMAHRAGFEDTFGVFMVADDDPRTLTEVLGADMPKRVIAPGVRTSYSNWGTALAVKVLEDVTGRPFRDFLQDDILSPLAMTRTTIDGPSFAPAHLQKGFSKGYDATGVLKAQEPMQIGAFAPVGGIAATAADMAQWMLILLNRGEHNGTILFDKATADLMWSRAFNDRPDAPDIAHGFFAKNYLGHEVYSHGGGTTSFRSNMVLVPSLELGVFVSQNTSQKANLVTELPDLIIQRLTPRGPSKKLTGLVPEKVGDYTGFYFANRRSFSKFEKLFGLVDMITISGGENGALALSTAGDVKAYFPVAGGGEVFRDRAGNQIAFSRDDRGQIVRISTGHHSYERTTGLKSPIALIAAIGI